MNSFIEKLQEKGYKAYFVKKEEGIEPILNKEISKAKTIGFGGSKTLEELNLYEFFQKRGNKVNWHWRKGELKNSDKADIYFSSANAVTLDGDFYFVDGNGNRLRNLTSEKEIYIVCGTNKLVENKKEAIKRIENIAAPLNAKRLNLNTPCVKIGRCQDCNNTERICNYYLWISRAKHRNINVIFVEGDYGY